MVAPSGGKTSPELPIPETMRAWVLGDPGELVPTALKYARERLEDAIKVVVKARLGSARSLAAE
jgi:hypothetical protein